LIEKFSLEKLNPSPAAINFTKLDYFNGLHIRDLSISDLANRMVPFYKAAGLTPDHSTLQKIAPIVRERLVTLDDAPELAGFFFKETAVTRVGRNFRVKCGTGIWYIAHSYNWSKSQPTTV
jgi:glutamyl-tRNA synthetase